MPIRTKNQASHKTQLPDTYTCEPDELPHANPSATYELTVRPNHDASGRFLKGNSAAKSKRLRVSLRGGLDPNKSDPVIKKFLQWARRYSSHRRKELAHLFGGELSAGVSALVESESQARAFAKYYTYLSALETDKQNAMNMITKVTQFEATARQSSLAAWELASRESKARPEKVLDLGQALLVGSDK